MFGFYANKQLTTGEGGMVDARDGEVTQRIDSARNQGRAPDMGWLDHGRLGFNYRLSDIACALGIAQLERLERMLAARAPSPTFTARRCARRGRGGAAVPDHDGELRGWFVFVVQVPRGVDRDETVRALAARGRPSEPYLPAIHLMSYYRERFGHRRGRVPGVRGRRGALAGAAVLPGDERGTGGARGGVSGRGAGGAPRRRRLSARVALPRATGPDLPAR